MSGLKREVGLTAAVCTAVGIVVSSSALVMLGQGFGLGGPAFVVAIIVALFINLFVAFSFAELASIMPLAGGINHYTLPTMGRFMGIFAVLAGYFAVSTLSNAAESSIAGLVVADIFLPGSGISPGVWALLLMVILTGINLLGVKSFARSQIIFASTMIVSMIALSMIGIFDLGSGTPLKTSITFDMAAGGGVLSMLGIAFWLFVGMEFVCPMAEEVKNPQKFIPVAMIAALLIIFVSDLLFGFMALKYVKMDALGSSSYPHVDAAMAVLGRNGQVWIGVISLVATASTLNTFIAAVPRMLYGMSKEGQFPAIFGKLNRFGVPYVGIIAVFVITVILLGTGISNVSAITTLILAGCIGWMLCYMIANLNVVILRFRYPDLKRSFKSPFGITLPVISFFGLAYMIYAIWPEDGTGMRQDIYFYSNLFLMICAVWSGYWVKFKMNKPLFETIPISVLLKETEDSLLTDEEVVDSGESMEQAEASA
ncbi:APC family permease [Desulforhopalus singaporensis]|uniref:Amino acid permease n=1 Tax=Desulforhopalus singaporensis TaxID=91360 RepID=A0A1H0SJM3_9BACT|nr:APC family permease [Desulforhopalus singaporensis]SDP41910.1 Amino acid permease [Desulforhopalus singaporensis]